MDSTKYLNNNSINLDALIGLDLTNQKYTFKDNKAYINQLPLEFKGYVQLIEEGHEIGCHTYDHINAWKTELFIVMKP